MLKPGDYLTDQTALFRFESWLPEGEGVVLEDCGVSRTLTLTIAEFAAMDLRAVKPLQKGVVGAGAG